MVKNHQQIHYANWRWIPHTIHGNSKITFNHCYLKLWCIFDRVLPFQILPIAICNIHVHRLLECIFFFVVTTKPSDINRYQIDIKKTVYISPQCDELMHSQNHEYQKINDTVGENQIKSITDNLWQWTMKTIWSNVTSSMPTDENWSLTCFYASGKEKKNKNKMISGIRSTIISLVVFFFSLNISRSN